MADVRRLAAFAVLAVLCLAGAGAAIVAGARGGDAEAAPGARGLLPAARAAGEPVVVFRASGAEAGELRVAGVSGTAPGARAVLPLRCARVHVAGGRGLCLARGEGFAQGYRARIFGPDLRVRAEVEVEGIPSRARVSPDGRRGSVTLFVSGHSYAADGAFSTRTTLLDLERGTRIGELEQFAVTHRGRRVTAVDRNFWGVTFARDGDTFFATMATGGRTFLIRGSVAERAARVLHENVECPSLSPDGTRIAYKRRTGSSARPWRLTVLDLGTLRETPLAETASVDDQAEWLDDEHVLYGLGGDVRVVRADGAGRPRPFLAGADSPAVVRW